MVSSRRPGTIGRIVRAAVASETLWFTAAIVVAKVVRYAKAGDVTHYPEVDDSFFPAWLRPLPTYWLDLPIVAAVLSGRRSLAAVAAGLSLVQMLQPQSFAVQNYVVVFWLLCWFSVRDRHHSLWLGRMVVSFLFLMAAIGKLTPGWIDGSHPAQFSPWALPWIQDRGYVLVLSELAVGLSFLLSPRLGAALNLAVFAGMFVSVSPFVWNVIGPAAGLTIMALCSNELKRSSIAVYFDPSCGVCQRVSRALGRVAPAAVVIGTLGALPAGVDPARAALHLASVDGDGRIFHGYETYCEIVARLPLLAFLTPILRTAPVSWIGRRIYLRFGARRACAA